MIARVTFDDADGEVELVLGDNGVWTCEDEDNEDWCRYLNVLAQGANLSPSNGTPYYQHVCEVGELLDAEVEFEEKEEMPEGTIY